MSKNVVAEIQREIGKEYFFNHGGDLEKRAEGLRMLLEAKKAGDPEAMYIVANLIFNRAIKVTNGNRDDYAFALLKKAASKGSVQARAFLNEYCEAQYKSKYSSRLNQNITGPLCDFRGRLIKIKRKGILTPIDAMLEFKNGKNVLTLSTNVFFVYCDEMLNHEQFEKAVLDGLRLWEGEYQVFNGQRITVKVNVTNEERLLDNLIVYPMTSTASNGIRTMSNMLATKKKKAQIKDLLESKRSFASTGIRWTANSMKFIYVQSDDGKFDDYEEIKHVAKHEFGHALGLGDLYESKSDSLSGVKQNTYPELDCYALGEKYYNLVMCDHHGPISNNDIEMVVLAFKENRMQHYQIGRLKCKISSALGRGN